MPESEVFDRLGKLTDKAISQFFTASKIPNMSLNLLGGAFQPEHVKFNPKGPAAENWKEGEYVFLLEFIDSIEIRKEGEYCSIFFWVKDVHNYKFPANTPVNKDTIKLLQKLKKQQVDPSRKETEVPCYTQLNHAPTRLNYWHTEFSIIAGDSTEKTPIEKTKSGYQRTAAEYVITHLLTEKFEKAVTHFDLIPPSIYKRKR